MNDQDLIKNYSRLEKKALDDSRTEKIWKNIELAYINRNAQIEEAQSLRQKTFIWGGLWGGAIASLVIVLSYTLIFNPVDNPPPLPLASDYSEERRILNEMALTFPGRLQGVVFKNGDMQLQLGNEDHLGTGDPVLVEISHSSGTTKILTFSGQAIKVDGNEYEVFLDSERKVFLMGKEGLWQPGEQNQKGEVLKAVAIDG